MPATISRMKAAPQPSRNQPMRKTISTTPLTPFVPFTHDIGEECIGEGTPPGVSIRGTGLGHPGAPSVSILGPSRDDLSIRIESISG